MQFASGTLEASVDTIGKVWDHAPWVAIVEEAGGRALDPDGRTDLTRTLTYTNGHIDEALRRLIADVRL